MCKLSQDSSSNKSYKDKYILNIMNMFNVVHIRRVFDHGMILPAIGGAEGTFSSVELCVPGPRDLVSA